MAIPKATLKTNTVLGFSGTPTHPITPAVIIKGIILGNNEHTKIRTDLNKYNIHKAINKNAQKTLSFNPFIINWLPSKKVILVPVSCTVCSVVSNNSFAFVSMPFKITGNSLVPTSAILTLIRVYCIVLSIKGKNIFVTAEFFTAVSSFFNCLRISARLLLTIASLGKE